MPLLNNMLCTSVLPRSAEELQSNLSLCSDADIIELRIDLLSDPDFTELRELVRQPCIVAVRTQEEGGFGQHTPEQLAHLLAAAANAGMDYVDVAWRYAQAILPHLHDCRATTVLSHHTSERAEAVLLHTAYDMMRTEAGVYKLVFNASEPADTATARRLCRAFAEHNKRFVVHAMGEAGTPSRLVCAVRGNAWTYTAPAKDATTAAGQLTIGEVHQHDLPHKMQGALLLGLLGYPTAHSRGKILHNALLARCFPGTSVPWLYLDAPAPNIEHFDAWRQIFHGMSITLPYKERITAFLDSCSGDVERSGVCNTIVRRNQSWHGFNTDMTALRTLLSPHTSFLEKGVLVVGTGGTARSALAALQQLGIERITCTGRNSERGAFLASHFGVKFLPEQYTGSERFGAIIQTTPMGMTPHEAQIPAAAQLLRYGILAMDVVYTPPLTPFAALAQQRGCTLISGVDMFILQATEQFRLFTGIDIQESDVRKTWEELTTGKTSDNPQNTTQRQMRAVTAAKLMGEDRSAQHIPDTMLIPNGTVGGTAIAPPSKSITHRLLFQGAMAGSPLRIRRPLWSEDTLVTAAALDALGYNPEGTTEYALLHGRQTRPDECSIDLRNSGTSARFLIALAATEEGTTTLVDGTERMQQRPMQEIISALRQLGADIDDTNGGLPLRINGKQLHGGDIELRAARSSQFISAMMLIAPRIDGPLHIRVEGAIVSEPYITMTMDMMNSAGVRVERYGNTFGIETGKPYSGGLCEVEGDYSGAAFLLAAAAVSGGDITVQHLAAPSLQGDAAIVGILEQFGARAERTGSEVRMMGGHVRAADIDMNHVPDLVPATAVVAMFADGTSRLRNVAHLAFKESDRLQALIDNAQKLGGLMYRENNDLVVEPRPLHGARIDPYGDHRIAMSFALAGLRVAGVEIAQPECVEKSYPEFWSIFYNLVR